MLKKLLFLMLLFLPWPPVAQATAPHGGTAQSFTVTDIEGNTIYVGTITSGTPFVQFNSTTSGVIFPEVTTTQMNAISGPQIGEFLYNTSNGAFMFYNGSSWNNVASATTSGSNLLAGNGSGGIANVTTLTGLTYNSGSQTLSVNNQNWVPNNIQVFTSTGTWTKPAGVSTVYVKCVGGGAGGGGNTGSTSYGGGGGSGSYSEGYIAVTGNVTVTVGAGGSGGSNANGTDGGASSFAGSTTLSANGGLHGFKTQTGGAGGSAGSGGQLNFAGGDGGAGIASGGAGGIGGSSAFGSGGAGAGTTGATGNAGNVPGSGGGGGSGTGGNGAAGAVIVYY